MLSRLQQRQNRVIHRTNLATPSPSAALPKIGTKGTFFLMQIASIGHWSKIIRLPTVTV